METLTRLVTESLARHGFDRPLDYRRLRWSQWFRCESPHSLLAVPSKPGVFAIAEEITEFGTSHVGTAEQSSAARSYPANEIVNRQNASTAVEERRFSAASSTQQKNAALAAEGATRRLLAVTQFFEADDMAFTLDRMLTRSNPMRARLASGRYFVRFVVIEDESQRRSISAALNQWIASQSIASASEKTSGIGAHFASSLELAEARVDLGTANGGEDAAVRPAEQSSASTLASSVGTAHPHLDSGAAANIHCPSPLPSGF
jgi:hypothetical protein